MSEGEIQQAIDEGRHDLENPLSTAPEHLAAVRETGLRLDRHQGVEHKTGRFSLDGAAFALAGGDLRWAAGAEIDYEEQHDDSGYGHAFVFGDTHDAADVLGSGGITFEGDRRRLSALGEMMLPPLPGWTVTLAGRHDSYDDVRRAFSHQVSSAYRVNRMLTVRGSWDRGSRPPSLAAMHASSTIFYPYVCDTRTFTGALADCDRAQVEMVSGGNPKLEPDGSEAFSAGAKASLGFLTVSADWFRIEISEAPALLPTQTLVDMEAKGQALRSTATARMVRSRGS